MTVLSFDRVTEVIQRLVTSDDVIKCPNCGHAHRLSDPDVCSRVVSYWGDDIHDLSCSHCNEDFLVKERVVRKFETAKNVADLTD